MNNHSVRATAASSTLIVFECFAVPIFVLFLYGASMKHAGWGGVVISGALCILIFAWWRTFLLEIGDGELIYRTLFSSRRKIRLEDIHEVVRAIDLISRGNRPPNRLEIHGVVNGRDVDFDINMKAFRLEDVRKIETILNATPPSKK